MYASFYASLGIYIYIFPDYIYILLILFYFSGFKTRTMIVSCPKDLSVGHLNIYHLANKVTDVNVFVYQSDILHIFGVSESLTSVTRWLAFQIIQSYEGTRMNLGIQGSRCMFIILFGSSLIGAMIWNLRMSKAFGSRSKQEEVLHSS